VTLVMERAEGAPPVEAGRPRVRRLLALLPWLAPALAWVLGLHYSDTPARYVALYAAYLVVAIVVPGTLVHRALRGTRGNLPEDVGYGSATGLLVLTIGWAISAAARLQTVLWVWPLLVIALFLAVPALRRHWRIPPDARRPLPARWSLIVAAAAFVVVMVAVPYWRGNPLPPTTAYYYQDLMYHLALVHEMTRSIPFQVPQLAGDTLRYHYLSDADMATASMITKIPPTVVLLRLWIVPIGVAAVLVCAALARELTGKWWAGALGGIAALFAVPIVAGEVVPTFGGDPLSLYSPSQTYAIPLFGLLIAVAVDVFRGRRLGWAWVLVLPLAVACAGAKSSTLPPFLAGLLLAALFVLVRQRDRLRPALGLLALTLVAIGVASKIFAGGGSGTLAVQPFSLLYWFKPYRQTIGVSDQIDGTRTLPFGVAHAGTGGLVFLLIIVVWWLLMQSPRLIGLVALTTPGTRRDPSAWLLGGIAVAGTGGAWLLWHPSDSQVYFFLTAAPFAALLTIWLLADQARSWRPVVAGVAAGLVWALVAPEGVHPGQFASIRQWTWVLFEPLLLTAAVAAVVALGALLVWRAVTGRFAWRAIPAGLIAAVLGAGLGGAVQVKTENDHSALTRGEAAARPGWDVTTDEMRAALWLDGHAGHDDVIATNVHCQPITQVRSCDARAFWVAGLAGRRTLVESWAYSDQTVTADGTNGLRYMLQPAPYPDRFALNQRAFARGDAADIDQLRTEFHVRWLYADSRALGGASPALGQVAELRYRAGPVSIYQL
jgi:hypothetical protein